MLLWRLEADFNPKARDQTNSGAEEVDNLTLEIRKNHRNRMLDRQKDTRQSVREWMQLNRYEYIEGLMRDRDAGEYVGGWRGWDNKSLVGVTGSENTGEQSLDPNKAWQTRLWQLSYVACFYTLAFLPPLYEVDNEVDLNLRLIVLFCLLRSGSGK